jgi:hypothetical protein
VASRLAGPVLKVSADRRGRQLPRPVLHPRAGKRHVPPVDRIRSCPNGLFATSATGTSRQVLTAANGSFRPLPGRSWRSAAPAIQERTPSRTQSPTVPVPLLTSAERGTTTALTGPSPQMSICHCSMSLLGELTCLFYARFRTISSGGSLPLDVSHPQQNLTTVVTVAWGQHEWALHRRHLRSHTEAVRPRPRTKKAARKHGRDHPRPRRSSLRAPPHTGVPPRV